VKTSLRTFTFGGCALALACLFATPASAADDLCQPGGYSVEYFNGTWETAFDAQQDLEALARLYGNTYEDEPVTYDLFYNQTGVGRDGAVQFEDLLDSFKQHAAEADGLIAARWELFWEILHGATSGDDSSTARLLEAIERLGSVVDGASADLQAQKVTALQELVASPPSLDDYATQRIRLDAHMTQREKLLLIGHSQGNVFLDGAFDYSLAKVGAASVKAVHVAPPSTDLRGDYTLADRDLVIEALRALGTVPDSNVRLPERRPSTPPYDRYNDSLAATYLHPAFDPVVQITTQVQAALAALVTPAGTGSTGYFTVTLTWDGTGDVDLHTFEPGGSHVYYSAKTGASGVLDVDNVTAEGPEHYFATCDPTLLQAGDYKIGINNYNGATGRIATIQVSSYEDGELLTRSMDVGPQLGSSGNASPLTVFTVTVAKDQAGNFTVTAAAPQ